MTILTPPAAFERRAEPSVLPQRTRPAPARMRWRSFGTGFLRSFPAVAIGGAVSTGVGVALGAVS